MILDSREYKAITEINSPHDDVRQHIVQKMHVIEWCAYNVDETNWYGR